MTGSGDAAASSDEKTIWVHSIMFSVKSQIHVGIFSGREMNVGKQKVSEALTRGTKYTALLRWGFGGWVGFLENPSLMLFPD